MTPYLRAEDRRADFNPLMLRTAEYDGKLWGVPKQFDVGVLYYRADRARAPRSWRELSRQATPGPGALPGLRLQLDADEGLTVALLDLAYAAGADPIISDDGKTANVDQPAVLAAVHFLRDAIRHRALPRSTVRLAVQASLSLYELGRATFLRGWPYVAARLHNDEETTGRSAQTRRRTAAHTKIVALPPWNPGGQRVAVLGGRNLVIPRSAPNPSGALHLIDFLTGYEQIRKDAKDVSPYPVLTALAVDPDVTDRPVVRAIQDTRVITRPSIPQYADASALISRGLRRILSSGSSAAADPGALRDINNDVQRVLNESP
jgi:multiple sugar transport system substrate-binding protein